MMLHENQLKLIRHLARFNLMDYQDCLDMLDTEDVGDRTALSYVFRPLTKNKYLSKDENNCVSILTKGRSLFPELTPLISTGGKDSDRRRVMKVSRMAALMEQNGIPVFPERKTYCPMYFIPSACWRKIAPGILSTTRFTGMLIAGSERLAVYDIGDGTMEWQAKAEGSLFYTRYGSYETKASGILFICNEEAREDAAKNIIRQTMWYRKQLLKEVCLERNKPARWSKAPIRLKAQYEHVYLTTPNNLLYSLERILSTQEYIQVLCEKEDALPLVEMTIQNDAEAWPRRFFINPACDLLKYIYFFATAKSYLKPQTDNNYYHSQISTELYIYPEDLPIARMYPELQKSEEVSVYVYRPEENIDFTHPLYSCARTPYYKTTASDVRADPTPDESDTGGNL